MVSASSGRLAMTAKKDASACFKRKPLCLPLVVSDERTKSTATVGNIRVTVTRSLITPALLSLIWNLYSSIRRGWFGLPAFAAFWLRKVYVAKAAFSLTIKVAALCSMTSRRTIAIRLLIMKKKDGVIH